MIFILVHSAADVLYCTVVYVALETGGKLFRKWLNFLVLRLYTVHILLVLPYTPAVRVCVCPYMHNVFRS